MLVFLRCLQNQFALSNAFLTTLYLGETIVTDFGNPIKSVEVSIYDLSSNF